MSQDLTPDELKKKIKIILKDADLEKTSAKKVRKQLEEDLKVDLTSRKEEISGIIQKVMDELENKSEAEGNDDEEEDEGDEEEVPSKRKRKVSSSDEAGVGGGGSDEGGSDYEPSDDSLPTKKNSKSSGKGRKSRKSATSGANSNSEASSGDEWGPSAKKKKGSLPGSGAGKKKRKDSDSDSDFKPAKRAGGGKGTGFTKPLKLSSDLADIVGKDVAPRHEVVKQMWAYIKENQLQDPKNKQFAICDEKLKKIIGEKKFRCFGMAKYLKNHMS